MKRFNSFQSMKENSNRNLNKTKPSLEMEVKNFIRLLKKSIISDKQILKSVKE